MDNSSDVVIEPNGVILLNLEVKH